MKEYFTPELIYDEPIDDVVMDYSDVGTDIGGEEEEE